MGDSQKGSDKPHHSPRFNSNDAVLANGASVLAGMALEYLSGKK
jgi:metal-dependent amidase/aminoacylase/carboxypeptidase family protein